MAGAVAVSEVPAEVGTDAFGVAALRSSQPSATSRLPEIIYYPYYAEDGSRLYDVVKFEKKQFRYRHYDHLGRWVWNARGIRRVPYRLPQLIAAVARGQTIYVCEGEKDCDAVAAAGGAATCNPGGAGKWKDTYSEYLRGANIVVVADRDDSGRRHALDVAGSLFAVAASVQIVQARAGKDASDHLAARHSLDDFEPLNVTRDDLRREALARIERRHRERERRASSQTASSITDPPLISRRDSEKWASDRWTALGLVDGQAAGDYYSALAAKIGCDRRTAERIKRELVQAGLIEVQKDGRHRRLVLTPHGERWKSMPFPRFARCFGAYARTARADGDGEVVRLPTEAPESPLTRSSASSGFDGVGFLKQLGVQKVATGDVIEFACPFHLDKRPSGTLSKDGLAFGCFSCGRSGGADDLLAELEGVTPILARRWIAEAYGEPATDVQRIVDIRPPHTASGSTTHMKEGET